MTIRFLIHTFLFTIVLAYCGCNDDVRIITPNDSVPTILVRGVLYDSLQLTVLISKVLPVVTGVIDYRLPNAEVILFKDGIVHAQLKLDTTRNSSNLSGSFYVSDSIIPLVEGSSYFLRVEAEGFTTVTSDTIIFHKVLNIDRSEVSELVNSDGFFSDSILIDLSGQVNRDYYGEVSLAGGIQRITANFPIQNPTNLGTVLDIFDSFGPRWVLAVDPQFGDFNYQFTDVSAAGRRRRADREYVYFLEILTAEQGYLEFVDEVLERQGRFEGLTGSDADLDPIPSNINGGFGYFTLSERHRLLFQIP